MLNPDMPMQELRLHMGEVTDREALVARAAIRWANSQREPSQEEIRKKDLLILKLRRFVEKVASVTPYVSATLSPGNIIRTKRPGWIEVHSGRAISSYHQLEGVKQQCDDLKADLDQKSPMYNLAVVEETLKEGNYHPILSMYRDLYMPGFHAGQKVRIWIEGIES